jgi:hypothetical protein
MPFLNDPINFIAGWAHRVLTGWGLVDSLATIIIYLIGTTILIVFAMFLDIMLVWVERKIVLGQTVLDHLA